MYDPKSGKFTLISTCFNTHHLVFAEDANNTLWTSAGGADNPVARLARPQDVRRDRRRGRRRRAGRRSCSTPTATASATIGSSPTSRSIRRRTSASSPGFYAVAVNPVDGTIWGTSLRLPRLRRARRIRAPIRRTPRSPRSTSRRCPGYGPRGGDIDRNGVVWASLASGHLASFDRRKCKAPLNGPNATGKHCPEGWTLYPFPGPQFKDVDRSGQRRGELLHLGRPVRHVRPRARTCRSPPAT